MSQNPAHNKGAAPKSTLKTVFLFGLMLLACLGVFLINGEPLFYFDSPAYVDQGTKLLAKLGISATQDGGAAGAAAAEASDSLVNGSRSAVYSVIAAIAVIIAGIELMPLANVALVLVVVWLVVRSVSNHQAFATPKTWLIALPLLVACAGSLPFYLAFVMPDILTSVLLLVVALVAIYGEGMNKWEYLLVFVLGSLAVVSHISHIAIAAALVPVVAVFALMFRNPRWWLATLTVAMMVLVGVGERMAFKVAAKTVADAEVVYIPFLTARLVEDGPGYRYLSESCAASELNTCVLFDALSKSDDPMRLTASHIIFETNPRLGSFQLLSPQDQASVAAEQYKFFFTVLAHEPVGTVLAILNNTAIQARLNSIKMTIPTPKIITNSGIAYPEWQQEFSGGRLSEQRSWITNVDTAHSGVYLVSLAVLLAGLVFQWRRDRKFAGLVLFVLLGIAANAFVCGAVSQPADRYGARVIWLLPFLATFMVILMASNKRRAEE